MLHERTRSILSCEGNNICGRDKLSQNGKYKRLNGHSAYSQTTRLQERPRHPHLKRKTRESTYQQRRHHKWSLWAIHPSQIIRYRCTLATTKALLRRTITNSPPNIVVILNIFWLTNWPDSVPRTHVAAQALSPIVRPDIAWQSRKQ